jgi:hypothetical protein
MTFGCTTSLNPACASELCLVAALDGIKMINILGDGWEVFIQCWKLYCYTISHLSVSTKTFENRRSQMWRSRFASHSASKSELFLRRFSHLPGLRRSRMDERVARRLSCFSPRMSQSICRRKHQLCPQGAVSTKTAVLHASLRLDKYWPDKPETYTRRQDFWFPVSSLKGFDFNFYGLDCVLFCLRMIYDRQSLWGFGPILSA